MRKNVCKYIKGKEGKSKIERSEGRGKKESGFLIYKKTYLIRGLAAFLAACY